MGYPPPSPLGREIKHVAGDPGDIVSRGTVIETLGHKMLTCAATLQQLGSNSVSDGQPQGEAIEKLQEAIGRSWEELRKAGELYEAVGPVIKRYGERLAIHQPVIEEVTGSCEDLWAAYEALPGSVEPRGLSDLGEPDPGGPQAQDRAKEDAAKKAAYQAWEDEAERFDTWYGFWDDAYEEAADDIGREMCGKPRDDWWDSWGLDDILTWAALIVGIVALFLGGWVLALAVALAVATVALTAVQSAHEEACLKDLLFAGLSVLPFGRMAGLTKGPHLIELGGRGRDVTGWQGPSVGTVTSELDDLGKLFTRATRHTDIASDLLGRTRKELAQEPRAPIRPGGPVHNAARTEGGLEKVSTFAGPLGEVETMASGAEHVDAIPFHRPQGSKLAGSSV